MTDALGTEKEIYYALCDHQEQHRRAELDSGQCLTGAHKDDLLIDINGQPARAFASQGQTRTAALSLKLAEREIFHDEFDEYPVLMLDDVLSELDAQRQAFVLNRIGGGQTLITCCEDARIAERTGGRVLTVQNGGSADVSASRQSGHRAAKRACSACSTWTPPHGRTARARRWKKWEQAGQVENAAGDELPKAFVLCSLGSGQTCYLSQLNTATLYKRSKASGLENL